MPQETAFTEEEFSNWLFDISRKPPSEVEDPTDPAIVRAVSLRLYGVRTGVVLRLRDENDAETTMHLNAAIAHQLFRTLISAGHNMEWIGKDGTVTLPPPPRAKSGH
ncbi:hypothetical protein [Rhodovulum sulfidophilum]|uniref:hypothetical protein n=1 Tax=Rhodovulum sulfidophilum TaxID=35806 RepID=UPI00117BC9D8|nr:hypothetical protein [Rhodovulum sulfidophilum]MBL3554640.1 hypothetical protein [Rhodovulum sulfidophilum]